MIPEDGLEREFGAAARGLGPLFSGLVAATLIALTLLVAVTLGMGEQQMTARVEPAATETFTPPVATPSPSATDIHLPPVPAGPFTATPTATARLAPPPARTSRPVRVYPTATRCPVNPWGWKYVYTVRSGDRLYRIAIATGTTVDNLMKANCLTSTTIYPGQKLYVPRLPATPTRAPTRTPSVPTPEIISFTLDPASQVLLGECVQIDWVIQGEVEEITLTAGTETLVSDGEKIGSTSDCPTVLGSRSYLLGASGPGGSDSATRSIVVVDELAPPVADFSASTSSGEAPLLVSFTDQSTGEIDTWSRTFVDGDSSSAQNPSHSYDSEGDYAVTLTVTGPGGSDSASTTVHVSEPAPSPPAAAFSASPTSGEAPLTVSFTDQSTGEIDTWSWTFGDGYSSANKNPSHEYAAAGDYTVTLDVTGPGGSDSASSTIHVTEPVPPPPVAGFSASPTSGEAPLAVSFTNQSTGEIDTWSWTFGDGGSSSAQSPSHTYDEPGDYAVSLTVTGPGGSDSATASIHVEPAPDAARARGSALLPGIALVLTVAALWWLPA